MPRTAALLATGLTVFTLLAAGCADNPDGVPVADQSPTPAASSAAPTPESSPATSGPAVPPSGRPTPPPLSGTDLPTLKPPAGVPKNPTDQIPKSIIAGRVIRGGSGPCFGVETDDGKLYALHSSQGIRLQEGSYVRVKVEPLLARINCGPGEHFSIVEANPVR